MYYCLICMVSKYAFLIKARHHRVNNGLYIKKYLTDKNYSRDYLNVNGCIKASLGISIINQSGSQQRQQDHCRQFIKLENNIKMTRNLMRMARMETKTLFVCNIGKQRFFP